MYDDIANPWLGGGGAVRAMELYRRLSSRHEITLVSGLFPGAEPETERHGLRLLRVGSARSYALSRVGYCRAAVAQLQRLEWDLWINEFSAFAPLRVPAALRRQGLLCFITSWDGTPSPNIRSWAVWRGCASNAPCAPMAAS
jgi:hypothetical protein